MGLGWGVCGGGHMACVGLALGVDSVCTFGRHFGWLAASRAYPQHSRRSIHRSWGSIDPNSPHGHHPPPNHKQPQEDKALLTPEVLTLVRDLARKEKAFEPNLAGLMALRKAKQEEIYANILGKRPALTFPAETKCVRAYVRCGCGCGVVRLCACSWPAWLLLQSINLEWNRARAPPSLNK